MHFILVSCSCFFFESHRLKRIASHRIASLTGGRAPPRVVAVGCRRRRAHRSARTRRTQVCAAARICTLVWQRAIIIICKYANHCLSVSQPLVFALAFADSQCVGIWAARSGRAARTRTHVCAQTIAAAASTVVRIVVVVVIIIIVTLAGSVLLLIVIVVVIVFIGHGRRRRTSIGVCAPLCHTRAGRRLASAAR